MLRISIVCGLLLVVGVGCGGVDKEIPPTVSASGTVLHNGKPVEGATVALQPKAGAEGLRPASGVTNAEGVFQLTTFISGTDQAAGAMPGEYVVSVSKLEAKAAMTPEDMTKAMTAGETPKGPKHLLPEKYAAAENSGLTASVTADGDNAFKFELAD